MIPLPASRPPLKHHQAAHPTQRAMPRSKISQTLQSLPKILRFPWSPKVCSFCSKMGAPEAFSPWNSKTRVRSPGGFALPDSNDIEVQAPKHADHDLFSHVQFRKLVDFDNETFKSYEKTSCSHITRIAPFGSGSFTIRIASVCEI
jgi:hypothetical protein